MEKEYVLMGRMQLKTRDYIKNLERENRKLQKKLDKAIQMLIDYNLPCDIDNFNIKNSDYCSSNCGVDEEIFKKCWLRYIEQELDK